MRSCSSSCIGRSLGAAIACIPFLLFAQLPNPALVGYFHNWQDANAPYIQLDAVDARYNVVDVAFAVPEFGTEYKMVFVPDQVSPTTFIAQVQTLQAQGRKVIISIGGATAPIALHSIAERDTFITRMIYIIDTYGFDGMDIDIEGASLSVSGGTIDAPVDAPIINLIEATKQIMASFFATNGYKMLLTMAPETAFVQGGQSAYGGIWGAYLPVIHALRDSLDLLHVQLYNSGSMFGIDGNIYTQGSADFIVAMCEAVIQGFTTAGGFFQGLSANKVAAGLPACPMAAGGGYTAPLIVEDAMQYLLGNGSPPGTYTLFEPNGYPDFRGMMTWSVNWDAAQSCSPPLEYADNFENIFGTTTSIANNERIGEALKIFPNPTKGNLNLIWNGGDPTDQFAILFDIRGVEVERWPLAGRELKLDISEIPSGVYFIRVEDQVMKIIKQ